MTTKKLDIQQVEGWIRALHEEKAALESRLSPLVEKRRRLEEQESILMELLGTLNSQPAPKEVHSAGQEARTSSTVSSAPTIRERVEARVVEILTDAGEPLHINDIHARYKERGWKVPGAGRPVNITSHIRVSKQIKSPKRGIYGLAELVGGDVAPRKVVKRKKKSTNR